MFEDGVRLDDILNALKQPTLNDKKKGTRESDAENLRYEEKKSLGDEVMKFEFARQMNSGVLR